jgi:signal transduction histidine kinase/DNA-binding response OmpR family regulator
MNCRIHKKNRSPNQGSILPSAIPGVFITLLFVICTVFYLLNSKQEHFASQSSKYQDAIYHRMASATMVAKSFQSFHHASDWVNPDAFKDFSTNSLASMPYIDFVTYAPALDHSERSEYENKYRDIGLGEFYIRQLESNGNTRVASKRAQYFPVLFIEPMARPDFSDTLLGLDINFASQRLSIQQAINSSEVTATPSIELPSLPERFLFYIATYEDGEIPFETRERHLYVKGLITLVIDPKKLLKSDLLPDSAEAKLELLAPNSSSLWTMRSQQAKQSLLFNGAQLTQQEEFHIGKQNYLLSLSYQPGFFIDDLIWILGSLLIGSICGAAASIALYNWLQANKARAESYAKSSFLATMSHEIRTPLNGILGMAELMTHTELNEDQKHYNHVIINSGKTLLSIINDILDFSKIEAGKLTIEQAPFDLNNIVEELSEIFAPMVHQKGISFAASISPEVSTSLIGDEVRIRQMLLNLISNAIKFTETGYVLLLVEQQDKQDQLKQLRFSVTDTGIGLSKAQQSKLFSRYSQATDNISKDYGGTGLGLAICKQLTELMDGKIGVRSKLGKGSHFWIELPLAATENATTNFSHKAYRNKRVLIVDDVEIARTILLQQCKQLGIQADSCTSADEALTLLQNDNSGHSRYQAILTDYDMPGMNGAEFSKTLLSLDKYAEVPVALMSASTILETDDSLNLPANILCKTLKPCSGSQLEKLLARLWASSTQPAPAGLRTHIAAPKKLHILIAEDNPVNTQVLAGMLNKQGHSSDHFENGQLAYEAYSSQPEIYDVILMDGEMPVMDGYEATKFIRSFESQHGKTETPIIALTAHVLPDYKQHCFKVGMNGFLSKPVSIRKLEDAFNDYVYNREVVNSD